MLLPLVIIISFLMNTTINAAAALPKAQPPTFEVIKKRLAFIKRAPDLNADNKEDLDVIVREGAQNAPSRVERLVLNDLCMRELTDLWKKYTSNFIVAQEDKGVFAVFEPEEYGKEIIHRASVLRPLDVRTDNDQAANKVLVTVQLKVEGKQKCPPLPFHPQFIMLVFDYIQREHYQRRTVSKFSHASLELVHKRAKEGVFEASLKSDFFCSQLFNAIKKPSATGTVRYLQLLYFYNAQRKVVLQKMKETPVHKIAPVFENEFKKVIEYLAIADKALADAEKSIKVAGENAQQAAAPAAGAGTGMNAETAKKQ